MNIYQATLTDYYQHPRNKGSLPNPDFSCAHHNPSCGDSVSMQGLIETETVVKLMFDGRGCVISQALASLLTEQCVGKTIADTLQLSPEYMQNLAGIPLGPTRLKCALLPLQALQDGLAEYVKGRRA